MMLDFEHMTVTNETMTFMKEMLPNWRLWHGSSRNKECAFDGGDCFGNCSFVRTVPLC